MNKFAIIERQYYVFRSNAMAHCNMTVKDSSNFRATKLAICKARMCMNYLQKLLSKFQNDKSAGANQFRKSMKEELDTRTADYQKHTAELNSLMHQARIQCRQYSLPG